MIFNHIVIDRDSISAPRHMAPKYLEYLHRLAANEGAHVLATLSQVTLRRRLLEPWCVEVSTVSTVSRECRGGVEGVSVDTSVEVSTVSRECRRRS